jgi:hypothetical protein
VTNTTGSPAYLVGYIDFNRDGDFLDTGEKSSTVTVNASGSQNVSFTTPTGMTAGTTYARFRLSSTQSQAESSVGAASSGEVEDYSLPIIALVPPPSCSPLSSFSRWDGGLPTAGTLGPHTVTALNGEVLTIISSPPTSGSFTSGRPDYLSFNTGSQTLLGVRRGGGTGAITTFLFSTTRSDLRMQVRDVLSTVEPVEITGYNGATPVYPSFTQLVNGAVISGANLNIVNDSDGGPQAAV